MEIRNRQELSPEYVYAVMLAAPKDFFTEPKPVPQVIEASAYFRQLMRISNDPVKTCADLLKGLRRIENLQEIPLKQLDRLFMPSREELIKSRATWEALMKVVEPKKDPRELEGPGEELRMRKFVPKTLEEEYEAIDYLAEVMGVDPPPGDLQIVIELLAFRVIPREDVA